jgi:hypothetical protein
MPFVPQPENENTPTGTGPDGIAGNLAPEMRALKARVNSINTSRGQEISDNTQAIAANTQAIGDVSDNLEAHLDSEEAHTPAAVGLGNLPNAVSSDYSENVNNKLALINAVYALGQDFFNALSQLETDVGTDINSLQNDKVNKSLTIGSTSPVLAFSAGNLSSPLSISFIPSEAALSSFSGDLALSRITGNIPNSRLEGGITWNKQAPVAVGNLISAVISSGDTLFLDSADVKGHSAFICPKESKAFLIHKAGDVRLSFQYSRVSGAHQGSFRAYRQRPTSTNITNGTSWVTASTSLATVTSVSSTKATETIDVSVQAGDVLYVDIAIPSGEGGRAVRVDSLAILTSDGTFVASVI